MSWTTWILASSVFLALYDLAKKASVRDNAVLPVLLVSTCCGAAAFALGTAVSGRLGAALAADSVTLALAAAKSVIVATSWIFTFCALRTLPITIATPIRASAPALVFIAAFFLYGEVPSFVQAIGMLAVFTASLAHPLMPWLLSFSAGAMLYVTAHELCPEASGRAGALSFIGGFALMMTLDVALS